MSSLRNACATVLIGILGFPALAMAAAEQPAATAAAFQGEVVYSEETGLLDFSGTLIVTQDNLRIDILQKQTDEQIRLLVDYGPGSLTVLYPDTLNGTTYDLASFDDAGGFVRIRDALLGRQPEPPADWTAADTEPAELDGAACTKHSATAPDGAIIEWWTAGDGLPLKVTGNRNELRINVTLSDYHPLDELDPQTFAVPEGFAIATSEGGVPEGLPQL